MRSAIFFIVLTALSFQAIAKLVFDIHGGYASQTVKANSFHDRGPGYTKDISLKGGLGAFLGIGASLQSRSVTGGPNLRLGVSIMHKGFHSTSSYADQNGITGTDAKYGVDCIQLDPGINICPQLRNLRFLAGIGFPVQIGAGKAYKTAYYCGFRAGIGYRGFLLTGGYQLGLNESINAMIGSTVDQSVMIRGKSNLLTLGVTLTPQWFAR